MKIVSIAVKNFKCYLDEVTVHFDMHAANRIAGPNGAGKSTLVEALEEAFITPYNSKAQSVVRLRPWGKELAPEVTVVFETETGRHQVHKRFLDKPKARLDRWNGCGWEKLAEGAQVQESLGQILGADFAERLPLLFSTQDRMAVPALAGSVADSIRGTLGAQVAGPKVLRFEKLLAAEEDNYLTPHGADKKTIRQAEDECVAAESEAEACRLTLRQVEAAQERARQAQAQRGHLCLERDRLLPELDVLERQERQAEAMDQQLRTAGLEWKAVESKLELGRRQETEIAALRCQIRSLTGRIAESEREAKDLDRHLAAAIEALRTAEQNVADVRVCQALLDERRQRAALAQEFSEIRANLGRATAQWSEYRNAEDQRQALRKQVRGPSAAEAAKLRSLTQDLALARASLEAQRLTVEFQVEQDVTLVVELGEPHGRHLVAKGARFAAQGEGAIDIAFPGYATMRCGGPAAGVSHLKQRVRTLEAAMLGLFGAFAVSTTAEFEELAEARAKLECEIQEAEIAGRVALGAADPATLPQRIEVLQRRYQAVVAGQPEWEHSPPDWRQMTETLAAAEETCRVARDRAGSAFAMALQQKNDAAGACGLVQASIRNGNEALQSANARLAVCQADGRTDGERRAELDKLAGDAGRIEPMLRSLQEQRLLLPAGVAARASEGREAVAALARRIEAEERAILEAQATQRALLQREPYDHLIRAEEKSAEAKRRALDLRTRRDAVKLLSELLAAERDAVLNHIAGPVAKKASQILGKVTGQKLADIRLDQEFALTGLTVKEGVAAGTDQVSAGEQEQVYAATRLALADVLLKGRPHVVVLDDVFAHTDEERLGRVIGLLRERAPHLQFILLTCHPERFAAWKETNRLQVCNRNGLVRVEGESNFRAAC